MSFGQEPEDDYECVDHGDPNIAPINIKSAGTLAWQHVVGVVVVVAAVVVVAFVVGCCCRCKSCCSTCC